MLRADKVLPSGTWSGEPLDSVVLDFDERYRRRIAMTGVGGLAFLLDLPEAAMLRAGDGLRLEDGRIVEVVAAPEPLTEIRASDPLALMRVAWHLGNRHLPTELLSKALRIRRDAVIEDMARGLGARTIALEAPFNPEGGAYVRAEAPAAGHRRHHDHAHDHNHDHHHGSPHDHAPGSGQDHDHAHGHAHDHSHGRDHDHEHAHDHGHAHETHGRAES
jgi:urease accessory protein